MLNLGFNLFQKRAALPCAKLALLCCAAVLAACGAQTDEPASASVPAFSATTTASSAAADQTSSSASSYIQPAVLKLTAPAPVDMQSGQIQAQSGIQAQATTANFSPVTRIQNTTLSGAYFFTIYNAERISALVGNPRWNEEGTAFWASTVPDTGLSPVYRFRNNFNGSYLYTIYESEKAEIVARYSATFTLEGTAWYASQTQLAGWSPLYRFRNLTNGTYLFSANETEKNNIVAFYASTFELEGVAYYVWQNTVTPPTSSNMVCGIPNFKTEVLAFVNAYRAKGATCYNAAYPEGKYFPPVAPLVWNSLLEQAATSHSTDMADNNFFSHNSATNGSIGLRIRATGYNYRSVGENIAGGQETVSQVMKSWMESTIKHCENIMDSPYPHRDIGVSCKINPNSEWKYYWTMDMGTLQ